jgi:dihydrofolate reductase
MTTGTFKITIHMVSSLDGIIAKKDNSVSWFETSDHYEKGVEVTEQDKEGFFKTIDCFIMGSRTYEHALELSRSYGWAYGDVTTMWYPTETCRLKERTLRFIRVVLTSW